MDQINVREAQASFPKDKDLVLAKISDKDLNSLRHPPLYKQIRTSWWGWSESKNYALVREPGQNRVWGPGPIAQRQLS